MKVIGLTGGIASGKSVVSSYLSRIHHLPIIDADRISHAVVMPGGTAIAQIKDTFGRRYITAEGGMDREAMGQRICEDEAAKKALEAILHPAITQCVLEEMDAYRAAGESLIVYDCPLLYEAHQEELVDEVMVVVTNLATRVKRLMDRDGIDEKLARQKIAIQLSDGDKMAKADVVLHNDGTPEDLEKALDHYISNLQATQ